MEDFKIILKILNEQIDHYKEMNNDDWSPDKNEGFKYGIEYCRDLVKNVIKVIRRSTY